MPYIFVPDGFHTNKLCSSLSLSKERFYLENGCFAFFEPPLGRGRFKLGPVGSKFQIEGVAPDQPFFFSEN